MDGLESRIDKIVHFRSLGITESSMARELCIDVSLLQEYEYLFKKQMAENHNLADLKRLAIDVGMHYSLLPISNRKKKTLFLIKKAIYEGSTTVRKIAEKSGLSLKSIYTYLREFKLESTHYRPRNLQ